MSADTNPDLAPCPFCGGEPATVKRRDNIDGTEFFYALACYCDGYSECAHKMAVRKTPQQAKADAIAAWNRRAPAPAQEPTDEEIADVSLEFVRMEPLSDFDYVAFARAVLARWGAPAASGESVARRPLTRPQIAAASREAQIQFCLDKQPTYEVALARAVEAAHGIKP